MQMTTEVYSTYNTLSNFNGNRNNLGSNVTAKLVKWLRYIFKNIGSKIHNYEIIDYI